MTVLPPAGSVRRVRAHVRGLAVNALAFGVVGLAVRGPLGLAAELRGAEYAEAAFPPPAVYVAPLFLTAAAVLVAVVLAARGADAGHRGFRIAPMLAVITVFLHLFVRESFEPLIAPPAVAVKDTVRFVAAVQALAAQSGLLPTTAEECAPALAGLGRPPYLVRGARLDRYAVVVRWPCTQVDLELDGRPPGTLRLCVSPDRREGVVTGVGLSGPVGTPMLVGPRTHGEPLAFPVRSGSDARAGADGGEVTP